MWVESNLSKKGTKDGCQKACLAEVDVDMSADWCGGTLNEVIDCGFTNSQ